MALIREDGEWVRDQISEAALISRGEVEAGRDTQGGQ